MLKWRFCVVACGNSTFSQTHKAGDNGINPNFVFPYIYLQFSSLFGSLDVSKCKLRYGSSWQNRLPVKISDFISLLNFEWHSQNEVGNIGILV